MVSKILSYNMFLLIQQKLLRVQKLFIYLAIWPPKVFAQVGQLLTTPTNQVSDFSLNF